MPIMISDCNGEKLLKSVNRHQKDITK